MEPSTPTPSNSVHTNEVSTSAQPESQVLPGAFALFGPSMRALWLNIGTLLTFFGIIVLLLIGMGASIWFGNQRTVEPAESLAVINNIGSALAVFVVFVGVIALYPSITYVQIQSARGAKVRFGEALQVGFKYLFRYIGLSIVVGFLILGGLLLLIVPGLIMVRRYFLVSYFLIDQDLSIGDAMKKSAESSKKYSWQIWGVIGVNILFGFIGVFPILGQIVGGILQFLYSFAPAIRYHQINKAYFGELSQGQGTSSAAPLPPAPIANVSNV